MSSNLPDEKYLWGQVRKYNDEQDRERTDEMRQRYIKEFNNYSEDAPWVNPKIDALKQMLHVKKLRELIGV